MAQTTRVYYDDGKTEIGRIGRPTVRVFRWIGSRRRCRRRCSRPRTAATTATAVSTRGLARAAWNNITGGTVQGASTITQQYAKNAYLSQEQSFSRKFKELVLSVKLETQSSKDEILADYLNTIYYGRGAYGIQAASRAYFGKSASKLDAAESAYLAAIIRAPSFYASKKARPTCVRVGLRRRRHGDHRRPHSGGGGRAGVPGADPVEWCLQLLQGARTATCWRAPAWRCWTSATPTTTSTSTGTG